MAETEGDEAFVPPGQHELGTIPMAEVFSQSGLDFLSRMRDGAYPLPPMAGLMRMRVVEVEEGRIVFESEPDGTLLNPIGSIHGGYAMTILDSCMSCAVHTTLAAGEAYTTAEAKVNMVRPIQPDTGRVRAEGRIIHRGRTLATADGRITNGDGKLLAHGTVTCTIMTLPTG